MIGYVWDQGISATKKLRIQKYLYTCQWGLRRSMDKMWSYCFTTSKWLLMSHSFTYSSKSCLLHIHLLLIAKPEKCFRGFNRILTHGLCVSTAVLHQLSHEGPYVGSRLIYWIHHTLERNETYEYCVNCRHTNEAPLKPRTHFSGLLCDCLNHNRNCNDHIFISFICTKHRV